MRVGGGSSPATTTPARQGYQRVVRLFRGSTDQFERKNAASGKESESLTGQFFTPWTLSSAD